MSELPADKSKAAWLVALDEMTRAEIAAFVGVSEATLYRWRLEPEFQAEVERHCRRLVGELIGPSLRRMLRIVRKGKDADAIKAAQLALKAAGWLNTQDVPDDGDGGPPERFVVEDPGDA